MKGVGTVGRERTEREREREEREREGNRERERGEERYGRERERGHSGRQRCRLPPPMVGDHANGGGGRASGRPVGRTATDTSNDVTAHRSTVNGWRQRLNSGESSHRAVSRRPVQRG